MVARLRPHHLPYGTPRVLRENADFCLLYQADYVNGFSRDLLMPLWVSYTLPPLVSADHYVSHCLPVEMINDVL